MKLTREQAIAEHRKMWNWIADETLKRKKSVSKSDYFATNNILNIPSHCCYCCEYGSCRECPIKWEQGSCTLSEYGEWLIRYYVDDYELASKYARIIANLPERLDNKK